MIDESFDGHGLECDLSRHAVANIVKADHLVLIDRHRAPHAGFERVTRQGGRLLDIQLQHVADGEFWSGRCVRDCFVVDRDFVCCDVNTGVINSSDFTCDDLACRDLTCGRFAGRRIDASRRRRSRLIVHAALAKKDIQLVHVLRCRHRCAPATLQCLHAILNHRLLVAARRHAEQRLECVMTRECRVSRIQTAITSDQQFLRDCLRIVPPHFTRDTSEELESLFHAFQNRFRFLGW